MKCIRLAYETFREKAYYRGHLWFDAVLTSWLSHYWVRLFDVPLQHRLLQDLCAAVMVFCYNNRGSLHIDHRKNVLMLAMKLYF